MRLVSGRALILAFPGLGDAIMASPAFHALRASGYALDAVCMQRITADYLSSTGLFEDVSCVPLLEMRLTEALKGILRFRRRRYDVSFTIYPSYRWQYHVVSLLIAARHRVIDASGLPYARLLNSAACATRGSHNTQRNLELLSKVPGVTNVTSSVGAAARGMRGGPVALHVGSMKYKGNEHKRWAPERFAELARRLAADGEEIVVIAGPHEIAASRFVAEQAGARASWICTHDFAELAAQLDRSAVVVGNDAGVVHLSASRGVPTVVLYGLTDPARVRPLGAHVTVVRPSPCPPCFLPSDRRFVCKRDIGFRCLTDLTVEDAYNATREALQAATASAR
jgi:ADP-heptose:LPS heptosyltransferase